jgi:hypothetical protein
MNLRYSKINASLEPERKYAEKKNKPEISDENILKFCLWYALEAGMTIVFDPEAKDNELVRNKLCTHLKKFFVKLAQFWGFGKLTNEPEQNKELRKVLQ